jgi:hypothetical protein
MYDNDLNLCTLLNFNYTQQIECNNAHTTLENAKITMAIEYEKLKILMLKVKILIQQTCELHNSNIISNITNGHWITNTPHTPHDKYNDKLIEKMIAYKEYNTQLEIVEHAITNVENAKNNVNKINTGGLQLFNNLLLYSQQLKYSNELCDIEMLKLLYNL